jgi:transposase-like protein
LLKAAAGQWDGRSVTLVGALPPSRDQTIPISDSAATELAQLLGSGTAGALIPELVRQGLQALIEAEAAAAIGADRHQHTDQRQGHRNGSRDRLLATPAGGSVFPSLLEPRRRVDRALWAVVMEAYVSGVSTRKVDELVVALGCESGISKSKVSRISQGLDTQVQAFLNRPLEFSLYPYVYLDATYLHGRGQARKQVNSRAVIVAAGITANGQREVLGIELGDSDDEAFWTAFLRRLREQGLSVVQLVISDAYDGLKKAIARCCQDMAAAALRSVLVQADAQAVGQQWDQVITMLTENFPAAADLMAQVMEEVLAFRSFPPEHWRKIWSPNPGASQQGDQAPHPRRRHLPQRRRDHPPGWCVAAGAAEGMAARRPTRLLGTVDGQAGQDERIG